MHVIDYNKRNFPTGNVLGSQEPATQLSKLVMKKYRKYQERIRTIDRKRTERFYSLWNNKHAEGRVEDFVDRIELSRAPRGRGFRYGTPLRGAHTRRVKRRAR